MNNANGKKKTLSEAQISELRERYFNAETSIEEEDALKCAVASNDNPRYDEIRAVLGYVAVKKSRRNVRRVNWGQRAMRVAAVATVAVVLGVSVWLIDGNRADNEAGDCYAYVQGQRIDDPAHVMSIVQGDFSDIREAANATDCDMQSHIDDIREALKDVDN